MNSLRNYDIVWLTGQPGAGKTVLGQAIKKHLDKSNSKKSVIVDGDDVRQLFENQNYSIDGRKKNIKFVQKLSQFLIGNDIIPIVCLVSPFKDLRDEVKAKYNCLEIYVHCSEIRGREQFHVDYYEVPNENFIAIDTTQKTVEHSFEELLNKLKQ